MTKAQGYKDHEETPDFSSRSWTGAGVCNLRAVPGTLGESLLESSLGEENQQPHHDLG